MGKSINASIGGAMSMTDIAPLPPPRSAIIDVDASGEQTVGDRARPVDLAVIKGQPSLRRQPMVDEEQGMHQIVAVIAGEDDAGRLVGEVAERAQQKVGKLVHLAKEF